MSRYRRYAKVDNEWDWSLHIADNLSDRDERHTTNKVATTDDEDPKEYGFEPDDENPGKVIISRSNDARTWPYFTSVPRASFMARFLQPRGTLDCQTLSHQRNRIYRKTATKLAR
jgi:hypothetical protein